MLGLLNKLDICRQPVRSVSRRVTEAVRTGVLDAALRQNTVAPVRYASDSLHATGAPRDRVLPVVIGSLAAVVPVEVEAVLEVSADLMPALAVRVTWLLIGSKK